MTGLTFTSSPGDRCPRHPSRVRLAISRLKARQGGSCKAHRLDGRKGTITAVMGKNRTFGSRAGLLPPGWNLNGDKAQGQAT